MTDWQVCIPREQWMAGVNHFSTKRAAIDFMDRWNNVEANSGNSSLTWHRNGNVYRGKA